MYMREIQAYTRGQSIGGLIKSALATSTPLGQYVSNGVNGTQQATEDIPLTTDGVSPPPSETGENSYHGLLVEPFLPEAAEILMAPIDPLDIEMKPGAGRFSRSYDFSERMVHVVL
ncbi:uncharacterized protein EI90DRAFT_3021413 [Cantharellus anzutake]|uniref:uncharacterized protein n=1 Tax=Cantharellus anzutake TaxID=1750568 RepID=UPI001903C5BF|nr:uncharacterized protein EI90DRAFT_3021413 [Cantharellus anzutake]KAF8316984.1 hypothetical protein EI90DRAFT_3021413 [Cantharellus anzutake]